MRPSWCGNTKSRMRQSTIARYLTSCSTTQRTGTETSARSMPTALIVSKDTEEKLAKACIASQICEKGTCAATLIEEQKEANKKKSKVRARVEHVFGAQDAMGRHFVRTIGLLRAKVKVGIMNLMYNMIRFVQMLRRDTKMTG